MTQPDLKIGICGNAVVNFHTDNFDVDTRFRMVKASGAFDYYEKSPLPGEIETYQAASARHGIPIRAGGFYYLKGRDEPLLGWHLQVARELGSLVQNVQVKPRDADGKLMTNDDVAEFYLWAAEMGDKAGVVPCFEVHVNMWSEHFGRIAAVAELVEHRGVKFNMTLDHSHVIFKIDNPREQAVMGMRDDIVAGHLELDPSRPNNVAFQWIHASYVRHAHARPAAPNNPINVWAAHPDGRKGRGIQYPFVKPLPGQWHSEWKEEALLAWKTVVLELLRHHASNPASRLGQISVEIIPGVDYGAGTKYSLFNDSIACANWIRQSWESMRREPRAADTGASGQPA